MSQTNIFQSPSGLTIHPPVRDTKSPVDVALDSFFKWRPCYKGAESGTTSVGTRPPAWYDMHLHDELLLKNVVLVPDLANQFATVSDTARKQYGPLPPISHEFPDHRFRNNQSLSRETLKNEYALTERFKVEAFYYCSTIAAMFQYKLETWHSVWSLDINQTKRNARPDGAASFRPIATELLPPASRNEVALLGRYGFEAFLSWEYKNIHAGGQRTMERIIEYGDKPFSWITCPGLGLCRKHSTIKANVKRVFCTGHRTGPDCSLPSLNLSSSVEKSPIPLKSTCKVRQTKSSRDKPEYIIQQAWAQAVANDATFFCFSSGNFEIIAIRHRETQTMFISGLIKASTCANYTKIQVGLYLSAYRDALARARHLQQCQQNPDSLPPLYKLDFDGEHSDLPCTFNSKDVGSKNSQNMVNECLLEALEVAPQIKLVTGECTGLFLGAFDENKFEIVGDRVQDPERAKRSSDTTKSRPNTSQIAPRVRIALTEAVALDYQNIQYHLDRITAYISWGLLDLALNSIDQCLSLSENCHDAHVFRCKALFKMRRWDDCLSACRQALQYPLEPSKTEEVIGLLLNARSPENSLPPPQDRSDGSCSSKFCPRSDVVTVVFKKALSDQVYEAFIHDTKSGWQCSQRVVVKVQSLCDELKSTIPRETENYRDLRFHVGDGMPKHYGLFSYKYPAGTYKFPIIVYFSIMEYAGVSLQKMISDDPTRAFIKNDSHGKLEQCLTGAHKRNIVHKNIARTHILCNSSFVPPRWSLISWGSAGEPDTLIAKKRKVENGAVPSLSIEREDSQLPHNIAGSGVSSVTSRDFSLNSKEKDWISLNHAFEGYLTFHKLKRPNGTNFRKRRG